MSIQIPEKNENDVLLALVGGYLTNKRAEVFNRLLRANCEEEFEKMKMQEERGLTLSETAGIMSALKNTKRLKIK